MSVNLAEYSDLKNKKVTLQYNSSPGEDGTVELVEAEGTLMAAQPGIGVMFRPSRHNQGQLIDEGNIVDIIAAPSKPRNIKQKNLRVVAADDVRAHLADRHAYPLTWVNQASPEQAMEAHAGIDHADLGHKHSATEAEADTEATEPVEAVTGE